MIPELRRLGETHAVLQAMQEDLGYLEKHEDHCHLDDCAVSASRLRTRRKITWSIYLLGSIV